MNRSFLNNIDGKNSILKQKILGLCIDEGDYSLADLSKDLNTSIPTITKLVGELIEEGWGNKALPADADRAYTV